VSLLTNQSTVSDNYLYIHKYISIKNVIAFLEQYLNIAHSIKIILI